MSNITDEKQEKNETLKLVYKIYHFIAKIFLYSILIILILVALMFILYFIDLQNNMKMGVTKQPLFGAYIIISPSMVPTIKVEDAVVIQRKEQNELKKGDIITFTSNDPRYSGLTITHRIVGVEKSKDNKVYYRTKGDNNNTEDSSLVPYDNINGKVILRIPKIGYIQYALTSSYGIVFLVVIPCLGIVIYDIIKLFKSIIGNTKGKIKEKKSVDKEEYIEIIEPYKDKENNTKNDNDDDIDLI